MQTDGQTNGRADRHHEFNSRFSPFGERAWKWLKFYGQTIAGYYDNHKKRVNTPSVENLTAFLMPNESCTVHTENIGVWNVNLISWEILLSRRHTEKNTDHYNAYTHTYIHIHTYILSHTCQRIGNLILKFIPWAPTDQDRVQNRRQAPTILRHILPLLSRGKKPVQMPLCPPQIPPDLLCDLTPASTMTHRDINCRKNANAARQ